MATDKEKQDINPLGGWLSSCFSDAAWIEQAHQRFRNDPARLLIIDDALAPGRYQLLSNAMRNDCDWETRSGVIRRSKEGRRASPQRTEWVDTTTFAGAQPAEQFFQHEAFVRARPGHEMSPGMIGLVRFKALLNNPAFLDMLGRITGVRPQGLQELLIRRMVRGDMAKPHDDAIGDRVFCLLLYFSDGWQPTYDGRFIMHMPDGERIVDPLPNRMVLFDVNAGLMHSVRPLDTAPLDWHRYNFSIWFT